MKRTRFSLLLCLGLAVLTLSPCSGGAAEDATPEQSISEQAVPPTPYDTPFVKYGDDEYTIGYFVYYNREKLQSLFSLKSDEQREEMLHDVIRSMIFDHVMTEEALGSGYQNELDYVAHNRNMENSTLHDLYVYHQFTKGFQPDMDALKQRYEEKKEEYFTAPQFTFRHLFFQTIDKSEEEQKKALENAQAALAKIKSGSSFEEVAQAYATPEKKIETVGPFTPRQYIKEGDNQKPINEVIETALLKLKPGEVGEIVQTKYGYEILKLETYEPEKYRPFEEVAGALFSEFRTQKRNEYIAGLMAEHWDKAVTEYSPDKIADASAPAETVLAKVYGEPYTKGEFDVLYDPAKMKRPGVTDEEVKARLEDELKNKILFRMVVAKLARDLNYDKIPAYRYVTGAQRNASLSRVWTQRQTEEFLKNLQITEEEKKEFYEKNPQYFKAAEKAHAGEMAFKLPQHNKDVPYEVFKAQQTALEKAKKAIERLKAGEEFAAVAKEMSESDTASKGGDLGVISWDTQDEKQRMLARDVLDLEDGKFSEEPVKKGDDYYVLINYGKEPEQTMPYEDSIVQDRLARAVKMQKQQKFQDELTDKKVDKEKIVYLMTDYTPLYSRNLGPISNDVPEEYKKAQ